MGVTTLFSVPLIRLKNELNCYYKTNKEAKAAAEALGFKKIKETVHGGQSVFTDGKRFITRDLDGHNGGAWKMTGSVKELGKKEHRVAPTTPT